VASQLLNPTGWNVAGKCGYVWGGTAAVCFVIAYFYLPELKQLVLFPYIEVPSSIWYFFKFYQFHPKSRRDLLLPVL
jgi:hypothetical protein